MKKHSIDRNPIVVVMVVIVGIVVAVPVKSDDPLSIELTEDRVDRGKYLVTAVIECAGCHSKRDPMRYGFPPVEGKALAGGLKYNRMGPNAYSANLTPFQLGSWNHQQIFDALTKGVRPDGRKLHGYMPYRIYRAMDHEEIYSIIAYLRTLSPVDEGPFVFENTTGHSFDGHRHEKGSLVRPGDEASPVERGQYLVTIADCDGCHQGSETANGSPFAGGTKFGFSYVDLLPRNITPHPVTGIGSWTEDQFVARFRAMQNADAIEVSIDDPRSIMPWWQYRNLTDRDLRAIHSYLMTVEPVDHLVPLTPQ